MTLRSLLFSAFAVALSALVMPSESSAQTTDWTFCAREGGTCSFSGTQQVRYGANGLYAYRTLSGGTACTNAVFGDPAPGFPKQCDTGTTSSSTASWSLCANEGGTCAFAGTQQVRYGANGLYAYRTLTGGTQCTNSVFGDPVPGVAKQCHTSTSTSTSTSTGSWSVCANEGGTCAFTGTQGVRYGANGLYAYRTLTGGTACTNGVFGDPAPGIAKQCAIGATSSTGSGGTTTDTTAPTVSISTPTTGSTYSTTQSTINLSGTAADNRGVVQVAWMNSAGGSGVASGTTSWSIANLPLQSGTNVITVTALDAAGNAATSTLTVTRSTTTSTPSTGGAPTLSVERLGSSSMRLSWTYTSWSSVDVYRNGVKVKNASNDGSTNDNVNGHGSYTYKLCAPGSTTVCSNSVSISN